VPISFFLVFFKKKRKRINEKEEQKWKHMLCGKDACIRAEKAWYKHLKKMKIENQKSETKLISKKEKEEELICRTPDPRKTTNQNYKFQKSPSKATKSRNR